MPIMQSRCDATREGKHSRREPFGGMDRPEVQQNFPIRTGETAFLCLQPIRS